jgi:hypothetical protein
MNNTRLLLSSCALFLSFGILALSLTTASAAQSSTGSFEASHRQFYWGDDVLPDHVVYPVLMLIDKAKLESASPTERIYTQVEYGNRRFEYTHALIEKENPELALTTATKGYKYLIHAGQEALDSDASPSLKQHVIKAIEYQDKQLAELRNSFSDADRAVLDQLQAEGESLKNRLASTNS